MASTSLIIMIGIATFFNFAIILHKWLNNNRVNAVIDIAVFVAIAYMFVGSISALAIGMVASFLFSIYLFFVKIEKKKKTRI